MKEGMTQRLRTVMYQRNVSYDIINASGIFSLANDSLANMGAGKGSRRLVILDSSLSGLKREIASYFDHHGICARVVLADAGEENKSMESVMAILDAVDDFPLKRRSEPIIVVSGGVLGDLVAFTASIYRRGIPHIKIPTTLMAYVDASVGIKCGVNYKGSKNRVGAFEPPYKVILDRSFLRSLPQRHILNGVGEIIKLAVILDAGLFAMLEQHGAACAKENFQCARGAKILDRSIDLMLSELTPNLYEDNLSRCVDFGHTFSLAIEMQRSGGFLHGEAVLADIMMSVFLAQTKGLIPPSVVTRIMNMIDVFEFQLPAISVSAEDMWASLMERVLHRNGQQRLPLPTAIGNHCFVNDVTFREVKAAYLMLQEWMNGCSRTQECRPLRAG